MYVCVFVCLCECRGLQVAGHADLQNTAGEEPWALSGWEFVPDCALSKLLSKLFPDDMRAHTHTTKRTEKTQRKWSQW